MSRTPPTGAVPDAIPMACTLGANDMRLRLARIRELSKRALRSHTLQDRVLQLHFAPEASAEMRALVEDERQCCAFLTFDLVERPDGVHLRITAPEQAGDFGPLLFSHFTLQVPTAPPLAARCGCGPSCAR